MAKHPFIEIKGAREHNLKNIDVNIKHNSFTVITGLSGSGKSSLAFDTLYAEGQRRYVESLSSYARQFLGRLNKPEVDYIKGIAPAIAIQQKVISSNPRSTVGTVTELYDYLKIMYARIGKTISPISGNEVKKHSVTDVVDFIKTFDEKEKLAILAPINTKAHVKDKDLISLFIDQGYSRIYRDGFENLSDLKDLIVDGETYLAIDRVSADQSEENLSRIADSIQIAFHEGIGEIGVLRMSDKSIHSFSKRFELDDMVFTEPSEQFFSFNTPYGACKTCEGFGSVISIDPNLVIPNKNLSVFEGAVVAWKGEKMGKYLDKFVLASAKYNFPIHKPVKDLTPEQFDFLWNGHSDVNGVAHFFKFVESKSYKIQYRVMLARYRGKTVCPDCQATRLRGDAKYVKVGAKSIIDLVLMPISSLIEFFDKLELSEHDTTVVNRLLLEINSRLSYIDKVGLSYLTLNRPANSLSGGESQRINLATSLGSSLVGSMYILDEPSIGLHPRDNDNLIHVLKNLQGIGNTVIVVEHDEEMMRSADDVIDIGPKAGVFGGEVVFNGAYKELKKAKNSLTADYLTGKEEIAVKDKRRTSSKKITIKGARANNLKNFDIDIPLNVFTGVAGVSGSGKTSLVKDILYPSLSKHFEKFGLKIGEHDNLEGDLDQLSDVVFVDQNPLGKSSRSNPASYVKAYDDIRDLFSKQQLSKIRGYKPGYFSFNVEGGRCDVCLGDGSVTVSMQFMADVHLTCENCGGKRFKEETLEVNYRDKNIFDILNMSIDEAIEFFGESIGKSEQKIVDKLTPLQKVGLGYLKLGQSSSTLSGGEAQRVKLASFLVLKNKSNKTFFIFDEPTTGLHFHDVKCLLVAFEELIDAGHSVLVIEHHMDVIKNVDHLIEIGPDGGEAGGNVIFEGVPEDLVNQKDSPTAKYLKEKLN